MKLEQSESDHNDAGKPVPANIYTDVISLENQYASRLHGVTWQVGNEPKGRPIEWNTIITDAYRERGKAWVAAIDTADSVELSEIAVAQQTKELPQIEPVELVVALAPVEPKPDKSDTSISEKVDEPKIKPATVTEVKAPSKTVSIKTVKTEPAAKPTEHPSQTVETAETTAPTVKTTEVVALAPTESDTKPKEEEKTKAEETKTPEPTNDKTDETSPAQETQDGPKPLSRRQADQLFVEAKKAMRAGQLAKGVELLNQVIANDPTNANAYFERARLNESQLKYQSAVEDFLKAAENDRANAGRYIKRAAKSWELMHRFRIKRLHRSAS
ncbi:MAG: hypothetical protein CMJ78_17540 [Planctomycetaceae bacterium]|nr:hypothetical protein [Planctomycetaceae bacterium]